MGRKKTRRPDMTILETLQKEFPGVVFETHCSDLYLFQEDLQAIAALLKTKGISYSKFIDDIDHKTWIEIPFGYMDEYIASKRKG